MKKTIFHVSLFALFFFVATQIFAQTPGTLTFSFTPIAHSPGYSGTRNVLAVWIQTSTGVFVKTKVRNAGPSTSDHLPTWAVNSGGSAFNCLSSNCNVTDATTGATLTNFTAKTITWDGKGVNGAANGSIVADGVYKVTIQETWNHGTGGTTTRSYSFTKGAIADHQKPADDADFKSITLDWVPSSTSSVEALKVAPIINVYPNPGAGVFNVDYNRASHIKVIDALGQVIYNQNTTQSENGNTTIDLSTFTNGLYMVLVDDGELTSNYKIVLNR